MLGEKAKDSEKIFSDDENGDKDVSRRLSVVI